MRLPTPALEWRVAHPAVHLHKTISKYDFGISPSVIKTGVRWPPCSNHPFSVGFESVGFGTCALLHNDFEASLKAILLNRATRVISCDVTDVEAAQ